MSTTLFLTEDIWNAAKSLGLADRNDRATRGRLEHPRSSRPLPAVPQTGEAEHPLDLTHLHVFFVAEAGRSAAFIVTKP